VVAANDQMAIGLLAALADAGRSVPDDISVVGFDDVPEAAYVRPALTTVHQDFALIGRRAVEALLAQFAPDTSDEASDAPIPPRLVVRASTAPPPAVG
jgi:DNA-binding LacI/PurR family transcriptional regulator